jgi:predicted kinase
MNSLFIFRGKAASGKTTMTDLLSKKLGIVVLRKDDIYDELAKYNLEHSVLNSASYDILAKILQSNIDRGCNVIIDIGLLHKPYIEQFLSKLKLKETKTVQFLCVCNDHEEWKKRMRQRLVNPAPNQCFESVEWAEAHYEKMDTTPFEGEFVIDSTDNTSVMMKKIYTAINLEKQI